MLVSLAPVLAAVWWLWRSRSQPSHTGTFPLPRFHFCNCKEKHHKFSQKSPKWISCSNFCTYYLANIPHICFVNICNADIIFASLVFMFLTALRPCSGRWSSPAALVFEGVSVLVPEKSYWSLQAPFSWLHPAPLLTQQWEISSALLPARGQSSDKDVIWKKPKNSVFL